MAAHIATQTTQPKVSEPSSTEINRLALLFNSGRYTELENQARELLEQYPGSGFVWKALGASLKAQRKVALFELQRATELLPDDAEAHGNLGNALKDLGRLDDAVASYHMALKFKPDYAETHYNLGNALQDLGRLDDAVESYHRALKFKPDFAEGHNNLGVAFKDLERLDDAVASYRLALEIRPDYAEAHYNLGNALKGLRQPDDAVASYHRALEIKPDFADAHSNLGNALSDLGQYDDAVASYHQALKFKPDYAEAHSNLGVALKELGRLDDAVASFQRALKFKPDYAEAHNNLGNALKELGLLDDAVASFQRALKFKPDYAEAHYNLGIALKDLGRLDDAVASYHLALKFKPGYAEAHSNLLFTHNYLSGQPAEALLSEAMRYGTLVGRQANAYQKWPNLPDPDRCLRVGLVSGDLCAHPVGHFVESVLGALAAHASGRLELIAYPSHFRCDALTERIKACCCGWHSAVGLSNEQLAKQIRDDGIDILMDLSGHTRHNRLPMFAWKPAPVQVSWLGYFATTGVTAMDYLIADPWTLPESEEAYFTEKIWRLPETRLCFTPPDVDVQVGPLPALSNGYITFGCFNNLTKMNDEVVALWAKILLSIPNSRLFLKAKQLNESSVRKNTIERFVTHGIDASRLVLEGYEPRKEYLAAYHRVDMAVDPFPFTGGTTSVEGLWMGVPVLTLAGEHFLSRQGVGILMNAGLPEWIATDTDDYVARAVSHAADLQRLAALRNGLRQQVLASPLFDASRFARHFESALRGMWR
ncbi:MAG: tetratricopeptide repeat protein, partial [Burkholderiales bacterium]